MMGILGDLKELVLGSKVRRDVVENNYQRPKPKYLAHELFIDANKLMKDMGGGPLKVKHNSNYVYIKDKTEFKDIYQMLLSEGKASDSLWYGLEKLVDAGNKIKTALDNDSLKFKVIKVKKVRTGYEIDFKDNVSGAVKDILTNQDNVGYHKIYLLSNQMKVRVKEKSDFVQFISGLKSNVKYLYRTNNNPLRNTVESYMTRGYALREEQKKQDDLNDLVGQDL